MKFKTLLLVISILNCVQLFSQSDTLNRYDSNIERTGWWKVYLDDNLNELKDSTEAAYYKYTVYKGNFDYFNMGIIGSKKSPVSSDLMGSKQADAIKPLNGTYQTFYKNGIVKFKIEAKAGIFKNYKEYYKNGNLKIHFDYSISCGKSALHYCIYTYKEDGTLKYEGTIKTP